MKKTLFIFLSSLCINAALSQFVNFNKEGQPIVRFSTTGDAIDAHDGEITYFNGTYYLYGTSYDCGFEWGNKDAPFCGFKVYASKDLKTWDYKGYLFDAQTKQWQCRCNGKTYGCFRPHVIFNKKTKRYVLWVNVYDNRVGYRVFTASKPTGPFKEVKEPHLAVNSDMPTAGLNNGDHDLFVDDDGTAYLAYTDWRKKGAIVIEKLSDDYLTGTGQYVDSVTNGATEAPAMFKREGRYYILYSDPNCGYCGGTGTSYKTASSPLGPWSQPVKITNNSCGGQPSFVSVIKYNAKTIYVYGSDLWNNGAKNEALANYFWTPLEFNANGKIQAIDCSNKVMKGGVIKLADNVIDSVQFTAKGDITGNTRYLQVWQSPMSGNLKEVSMTIFRSGYPDGELVFEVFKINAKDYPIGLPLFSKKVASSSIGWSPNQLKIYPGLDVKKNERLAFILRSESTPLSGRYGGVFGQSPNYGNNRAYISKDRGSTYVLDSGRILKYTVDLEN